MNIPITWTPDELRAMRELLDASFAPSATAAHQPHASPEARNAAIEKLTALGCTLEDTRNYLRIVRTDISSWADYLESAAAYDATPPPAVQVYRKTASTQDIARRHADKWFVAIADEQSLGRGRLGRQWTAPPGACVLMSITWPDASDLSTLDASWYRVAVAVAECAEHFLGAESHRVRIKWPNDIVVDERKLAGILIERAGSASVIGIGLNVGLLEDQLPDHLASRATSLAMLGSPVDRLPVIADLIARCHRLLSESNKQLVLENWRRRSRLGYPARFLSRGHEIAGTVLDLDADAGLIVRRETGELITLPAASTSVVPDQA